MAEIDVVLPDGSHKTLPADSTAADVAASIGARLAKDALAARLNGVLSDLSATVPDGAHVGIVTPASDDGREILRHSSAHVMAQAVTRLWPGAKYAIGPAIENGFYYDFELPGGAHFTDEDLARIEATMREIVSEDQPFTRREMSIDEGLALFAEQPFKIEIITKVKEGADDDEDLGEVAAGSVVSVYANSEGFVDLCRGPHVPSTKRLGHFKLMRVAGAYWRGDEKRPQLQRVYGTAWESAEALAAHLHQLEEAEKRDHRRLATELDLLSFPSELGGGLAVWHPRGGIVRKQMEDFSRARHLEGGYEFVVTPHLANARLFETSGHLGFYKDGMYPPMEMDNGTYYMKPMNCPMHCLIFRSRARSYRELPLRLFELGTVYRYERAGTLHGLMRIRGFTQDDSHIYCTEDQLQEEIISLLGFVMDVLRAFGFSEFTANLSTKDPEKYVGTDEIWEKSTDALRGALERFGLEYQIKKGDAAFYGPKIDIDVRDAIGRTWQLSTIQCDFNHPERFDLEYVGADNQRHRPIMLHRALFGSIERFFGVLLEHYAGNLPTWLAPEQVRVLGVRNDHDDYARDVAAQLKESGVRVGVEPANEPLGARIRRAKMEKIPYVLVVGDDDVASGTLGVNARGSNDPSRGVSLSDFATALHAEILAHGRPDAD
ncbi:MAG TPA: threonine--tRNA ligase [Acidimicrobiales bacterium]|nr:threonine--tRNA ligase [Acidimicrobiales bacterium]